MAMLKELDAESRLERIAGNSAAIPAILKGPQSVSDVEVDWLQTFGDGDPEDSSSGPAVLFQVLKMRDGPTRRFVGEATEIKTKLTKLAVYSWTSFVCGWHDTTVFDAGFE